MSYVYFTQCSDEMLRDAIKDGVRIICNSEPRDLPNTWRGGLWHELRLAEQTHVESASDEGLSTDEICDLIEAEFTTTYDPYEDD